MGAGQHTMRKLRLKDIIKKSVKFVTIRLRQGSVLNGCLNLGSGRSGEILAGVQSDLCKKRWQKAKKNLHPNVESVGELNIL